MRCNKNITLNLKNITVHFTGKEKIITLSLIILILSFVNITLSSSDIFYSPNVSALSYQTSTNIGFTFLPTLNVSLSSNNLTINNLVPGGNAVDSNTITINVSTNIAEGYNLYATVGDSNNETTNLTNVSNNNYTFTPLSSNVSELSNFTNNTWGYSYSNDSGTTWISGDYNNASTGYNGLPLYTDTGIKLVEKADSTNSTVNFKIAAKAGNTQPSGEYTNVINFTVVSNTIPTTMLDAFIASGAEMHNGYFKMQDMTSEICKSIDVEESELQLIDIRDDKVYWVAKLKDGNCWMTQNLDLAGEAKLYSETSDVPNGFSENEGTPYYTLPASSTSGFNDNSIAYVYNVPYDNTERTNCTSAPGCYSYYSWTAAIAGNLTSFNSDASYSICSKGWKLPTSKGYSGRLESDFYNLATSYGMSDTNTYQSTEEFYNQAGPDTIPNFVISGIYSSDGFNPNWGYYFSSSTAYGQYGPYVFRLQIDQNSIYTNGNGNRKVGCAIRCIAR